MRARTEYFYFLLIYLMAVIFFAIDKYFSSMSDGEKLAYEDACL